MNRPAKRRRRTAAKSAMGEDEQQAEDEPVDGRPPTTIAAE